MNDQYWSWLLTAVGLTGFILAGRKVWWAWYINIACQALWFSYAIVTEQYGFIVAALAYTVVFTQNAIKWTKAREREVPIPKSGDVATVIDSGVIYISIDELIDLNVEQFKNDLFTTLNDKAQGRYVEVWTEQLAHEGLEVYWEIFAHKAKTPPLSNTI